MSKFSKGKKRKDPAISTAALPDIVFMLLFFFMVTTVFKEKESKKLEIDKVAIKETIDLEKKYKSFLFLDWKSSRKSRRFQSSIRR